MTQPGASKALQEVETTFGTPLFVYDEAHLRARCREAGVTEVIQQLRAATAGIPGMRVFFQNPPPIAVVEGALTFNARQSERDQFLRVIGRHRGIHRQQQRLPRTPHRMRGAHAVAPTIGGRPVDPIRAAADAAHQPRPELRVQLQPPGGVGERNAGLARGPLPGTGRPGAPGRSRSRSAGIS